MTRKITRTNVTIHNAPWISQMMTAAMALDKGISRAISRVFDWICWGTYIKFVVKLGGHKSIHPLDGEWHEYGAVEYDKYRAAARNRTCGPDEIDNDEEFRLINDHQFQLRLIDWAQGVMHFWSHRMTAVNGFPEDLVGWLQLSYVDGLDSDEAHFYVPEFKLSIPAEWDKLNVKSKRKIAEAVDWLAGQLDLMYDQMTWLLPEDIEKAERVLSQLRGDTDDIAREDWENSQASAYAADDVSYALPA